jgi:hypothetical protein
MNTHNTDTNRTMSEYELLRQQKILRNEEKLRSLGLLPQLKSSITTTRSVLQNRTNKSNIRNTRSNHRDRVVPKGLKHEQHRSTERRMSKRLQGYSPSAIAENRSNDIEEHLESNNQSDSSIPLKPMKKQFIGNNKTLTKEHCLMRIRTMTKAQLEQRIRVIERMQGQHCITKLQTMYECCMEEQLYDLATQTQNAIQRLTV